jgi:hypothetical protein
MHFESMCDLYNRIPMFFGGGGMLCLSEPNAGIKCRHDLRLLVVATTKLPVFMLVPGPEPHSGCEPAWMLTSAATILKSTVKSTVIFQSVPNVGELKH